MVLLASVFEGGDFFAQKVQRFLDGGEIFLHLVVVAAALVGVSGLDKIGQALEYLPLAARLLLLELASEFLQESVILGIFLLTPVARFIECGAGPKRPADPEGTKLCHFASIEILDLVMLCLDVGWLLHKQFGLND